MLGFSTIKLVVIGVIVAAIVGYIAFLRLEIINYKAQATKYEAAYNQVVTEQNAKLVAIKTEEAAQDKVRAESAAAAAKVIFDAQNANLKAIHENQAFKTVVIPNLARQLANSTPGVSDSVSTTTHSGSNQESASGKTNTVNAPAVATLEDFLAANEINKAQYLQCAKDKLDWITLWNQTVTNLNGTK